MKRFVCVKKENSDPDVEIIRKINNNLKNEYDDNCKNLSKKDPKQAEKERIEEHKANSPYPKDKEGEGFEFKGLENGMYVWTRGEKSVRGKTFNIVKKAIDRFIRDKLLEKQRAEKAEEKERKKEARKKKQEEIRLKQEAKNKPLQLLK